jgi:hypothetical protein
MAQFAVLIYMPAPADPNELTPELLAELEEFPALVAKLGGQILTGYALQPSTRGRSVRNELITDGPFAEAKEVVAGFFIMEAPDLDTAVRIAEQDPSVRVGGGVEVRPLYVPPAA